MTDDEFVQQFEGLELPFEQWTHRAHVRLAFIYCRRHGREGAIERLRRGIKAYNAANDVPEGPTTGYNETTTVSFAWMVHAIMTAYEDLYGYSGGGGDEDRTYLDDAMIRVIPAPAGLFVLGLAAIRPRRRR